MRRAVGVIVARRGRRLSLLTRSREKACAGWPTASSNKAGRIMTTTAIIIIMVVVEGRVCLAGGGWWVISIGPWRATWLHVVECNLHVHSTRQTRHRQLSTMNA